MTDWHAERSPDRSARAMVVLMLAALLLVAVVPLAFLAALVMMILGHVVGGLAVIGGSVLVAGIAVWLAGMSGVRHMRNLLSGGFRTVRLDGSQYAGQYADVDEPAATDYANVVQVDPSDYTEVR